MRIPGEQAEGIINRAEVYQDGYGMWRFEYAGIGSDDSCNTEAEAWNELAAAANSMADSYDWRKCEMECVRACYIPADKKYIF